MKRRQYAASCQGRHQGASLWRIWKLGGVPVLVYETIDRADRDAVLAELEKRA